MVFDNNNQYQRNTDLMDILNLISIIMQFNSIEEDKDYKQYIHQFFNNIQQEIDKLHVENDQIMAKLDEIIGRNNERN